MALGDNIDEAGERRSTSLGSGRAWLGEEHDEIDRMSDVERNADLGLALEPANPWTMPLARSITITGGSPGRRNSQTGLRRGNAQQRVVCGTTEPPRVEQELVFEVESGGRLARSCSSTLFARLAGIEK